MSPVRKSSCKLEAKAQYTGRQAMDGRFAMTLTVHHSKLLCCVGLMESVRCRQNLSTGQGDLSAVGKVMSNKSYLYLSASHCPPAVLQTGLFVPLGSMSESSAFIPV